MAYKFDTELTREGIKSLIDYDNKLFTEDIWGIAITGDPDWRRNGGMVDVVKVLAKRSMDND